MIKKTILFSATIMLCLVSVNSMAQDKKDKKEIIIKGNDKGEQMVIVVDGEKVTLNGKEINGEDNKRVMIMKKPLARGQWRSLDRDTTIRFWAPGLEGILEEMLQDGSGRPMIREGMPIRKPRLGVQLEETESGKGLKVLDVSPDSPADKAGIKKDDIISHIGDQEVGSIDDFRASLDRQETESRLDIMRGGKKINLVVKFPKPLRRGRF